MAIKTNKKQRSKTRIKRKSAESLTTLPSLNQKKSSPPTTKTIEKTSKLRTIMSHKLGESVPATVYLPIGVHDKPKELVFLNRNEKISRNDIILSALDLYFQKHGVEGVEVLINQG